MTETPRVLVLSPTKQSFLGVNYWPVRGGYFAHQGRMLHRVVWQHHHGPIVRSTHVHHVDHDVTNNQIENLEAIPAPDHVAHHASTPAHQAAARRNQKIAQPFAAAAQKRPENRAKHAAYKQAYWDTHPLIEHTCLLCGTVYARRSKKARYCSERCRTVAKYRLKAWGTLHR